jgi:hypothetical protein
MIYKGVYRDGIVVLHGEVDLQNGTPVNVNPAASRKSSKASRTRAESRAPAKTKKNRKNASPLPGFGMWKDRWPASMSSEEIARQFRRDVSRRTR